MNGEGRTSDWAMRAAGLLTWAAVGAPAMLALADKPSQGLEPRFGSWLICWAAFGACLVMISPDARRSGVAHRNRMLSAALCVLGLATNAIIPFAISGVAIGGALLVIAAACLVPAWRTSTAAAIVAAQSIGLGIVYATVWPAGISMIAAAAFAGFQFFALRTADVAERERRAREELGAALAELRATQSLLAQSARQGERVRIAREIHDEMGHHLAALSLNLEAAWARTEPGSRPRELIATCCTLSSLMLSDVRAVVSDLKEDGGEGALNVAAAIRELSGRLPSLRVDVAVEKGFACEEPAHALALLRTAQEFISNTLKHSASRSLRIALCREADRLVLNADDDGPALAPPRPARGLADLRKRLEELGGGLETGSRNAAGPDQRPPGFTLHAWLPAPSEGGRE